MLYKEYDFPFRILVLPEQMKNKYHLKYYVLLASVSVCVTSSILSR